MKRIFKDKPPTGSRLAGRSSHYFIFWVSQTISEANRLKSKLSCLKFLYALATFFTLVYYSLTDNGSEGVIIELLTFVNGEWGFSPHNRWREFSRHFILHLAITSFLVCLLSISLSLQCKYRVLES